MAVALFHVGEQVALRLDIALLGGGKKLIDTGNVQPDGGVGLGLLIQIRIFITLLWCE
ncbi:hypothetical protein D3C72_1877340 [compost metagenome]